MTSDLRSACTCGGIAGYVGQYQHGFYTAADVANLGACPRHRLWQVLVRAGSCRLVCAAQDVEHITRCLEAGGDYVRDVSEPARNRNGDVNIPAPEQIGGAS